MWFTFTLLTVAAWGTADLFYKKSSNPNDRYSHLKIVVAVGTVMGIHALVYMLVEGISFNPFQMVRYFPVSALYILSMTVGYVGLRYIELSISSPVQNSSGAITTILCFIFFSQRLSGLEVASVILITLGVVGLAVLEKLNDRKTLVLKPEDKKYHTGFVAIIFPILYCIIDGLGTFADAVYLDEKELISEDDALLAYEFTFLICAAICFIYLRFVKKERVRLIGERSKTYAAVFETAGQFFYVFAMSGNAIIAAPAISAYSVFSVVLSAIFLKEKLSKKQYAVISAVLLGIILLGVSEGLSE